MEMTSLILINSSCLNTAVSDVVLHEPPDAEVDGLELRVADDVVAGVPSAKKITKYKP